METLHFKAGDDVPETIERYGEGSARLTFLRFGVDVEVRRQDNGACEVRPITPLAEGEAVMIGGKPLTNGPIEFVGGPTSVGTTPFNAEAEGRP